MCRGADFSVIERTAALTFGVNKTIQNFLIVIFMISKNVHLYLPS